ncbi:MAG: T9SS type A sorting domain-containing protein [Salibacteraceae bacterium]
MLKPLFSFIFLPLLWLLSFSCIAQTPLSVDAGTDQHMCIDINNGIDTTEIGGMPSAMGGIPPYSYSWSFTYTNANGFVIYGSDFLNDTTLANPLIENHFYHNSTTDPGLPYLVLTVTDSAGTISHDSIIVTFSTFAMTLGGPQTFYVKKGDSVLCHGNTIIGGIDTLYNSWSPNHGILSVVDQEFWASPDTTTSYTLTVTDAVGCTQSGPENDVTVVVFPVGVEESNTKTRIKLYPNPASNFLQIERNQNVKNETLIVYDISGKEVFRTMLNSPIQTIDVSGLVKGSYSFIIGNVNEKVILR